jgi:hypothetical protein
METRRQTTLKFGLRVGLTLGAIVGLVGCGDMEGDADSLEDAAKLGGNGLIGLNGINGLNGLTLTNGLTGMNGIAGLNGLSLTNGLVMVNGLAESSGLMTTDAGRKTIAYMARCALSPGDTLIKRDQNGASYTFAGGLGLCPAWKNGGIATNRSCQNLISACMMAHINTAGVNVPLWLASEAPQIGWGYSSSYPKQEGTFFGNIMMTGDLRNIGMAGVTGPVAYFCEGAGITAGVVAGRLTEGASNVPYKNPYGSNVKCVNGQTAAGMKSTGGQTGPDGFKQACANGYCFQNGEPITVWRNPSYTPAFDGGYRYKIHPMSSLAKAVDVPYNATTNGTRIQQYGSWEFDGQRFQIAKVGANWQIAMKSATRKCLGLVGTSTANTTGVEVQDCNGSSRQAWAITANANDGAFYFRNIAANRCLDVPYGSSADGVPLQVYDCNYQANQRFKVTAGY